MKKSNIIVDTDIGSDVDDAAALAILHNFEAQGKINILAITDCTTNYSGAVTVKSINTWFGREDIPIGVYKGTPFMEGEECKKYTVPIMNTYLKNHTKPVFDDAVRILRKALADNREITLVSIGMFNNIAQLLKSQPDDISSLNGIQLVEQSVCKMYSMAGNFEDLSAVEYNVKCDTASAKYVTQNFPKPIVYSGFELGSQIRSGVKIKNSDKDHPVRIAFEIWSSDWQRESWDPITVFCAVEQQNDLFTEKTNVGVEFDSQGRIVLNPKGKDSYLMLNSAPDRVKTVLDELIV